MSDELHFMRLSGPEIAAAARAVFSHIRRPDRQAWAKGLLDAVYGYDDFLADLESILRVVERSKTHPEEVQEGVFTHEAHYFFTVLEEWWKAMQAAGEQPPSATLH
jgi:hypothetical protein